MDWVEVVRSQLKPVVSFQFTQKLHASVGVEPLPRSLNADDYPLCYTDIDMDSNFKYIKLNVTNA